MKKLCNKKLCTTLCSMAAMIGTLITPAFASNGIANSQLGKGLTNLINDVSLYLVFICPIVGGAAAIYFMVRRSMSDENDGKLWEKRIKIAIACGVGGLLVSLVINLISSYFV